MKVWTILAIFRFTLQLDGVSCWKIIKLCIELSFGFVFDFAEKLSILKILLENNPKSIDVKNNDGRTPLALAVDGYIRKFQINSYADIVYCATFNSNSTDKLLILFSNLCFI